MGPDSLSVRALVASACLFICLLWAAGGSASAQGGGKPPARIARLTIAYPYDGAVFPPEIAAPRFHWNDGISEVSVWVVSFSFEDGHRTIRTRLAAPEFEPSRALWETIKRHSVESPVRMTVTGWGGADGRSALSTGAVHFYTSRDRVGAPVFYRQVPVPFLDDGFRRARWRLGDIASYRPPPVVMKNIPVCSSCHAFSSDGKRFSMEMHRDKDGGAQFIAPVQRHVRLSKDDFMSWNDYPKPETLPKSRGLFGRMSPTGRYIAASVNEISVALITNDRTFSQVFFPVYGILGWYSAASGTIRPLPGADDFRFVHANPEWSPDESYIVFARAPEKRKAYEEVTKVASLFIDASPDELNRRYHIKFDLCRIPFNGGKGGVAKPLCGASDNGMSNYFPRVSPDGKWIVFTQSRSGIMLEPGSRLFIIPAEGGRAREMTCNRSRFNSWHSWSPNGRWLLFSSKVNTLFTEIFLTHVDQEGRDSPPVLIHRFSDKDLAANVPEFVNVDARAIRKIELEGF